MSAITAAKSAAMASSAKRRAASAPSPSSRFENSGMKAMLKAPSAKKRRNMLGSRKATKNASATGPAPRKAAMAMSRRKPSTRLAMVQPPTVAKPRRRRTGAGVMRPPGGGSCRHAPA